MEANEYIEQAAMRHGDVKNYNEHYKKYSTEELHKLIGSSGSKLNWEKLKAMQKIIVQRAKEKTGDSDASLLKRTLQELEAELENAIYVGDKESANMFIRLIKEKKAKTGDANISREERYPRTNKILTLKNSGTGYIVKVTKNGQVITTKNFDESKKALGFYGRESNKLSNENAMWTGDKMLNEADKTGDGKAEIIIKINKLMAKQRNANKVESDKIQREINKLEKEADKTGDTCTGTKDIPTIDELNEAAEARHGDDEYSALSPAELKAEIKIATDRGDKQQASRLAEALKARTSKKVFKSGIFGTKSTLTMDEDDKTGDASLSSLSLKELDKLLRKADKDSDYDRMGIIQKEIIKQTREAMKTMTIHKAGDANFIKSQMDKLQELMKQFREAMSKGDEAEAKRIMKLTNKVKTSDTCTVPTIDELNEQAEARHGDAKQGYSSKELEAFTLEDLYILLDDGVISNRAYNSELMRRESEEL